MFKIHVLSLSVMLAATTPVVLAAQSQFEMNAQADTGYRRADSTLNAVYGRLLAKYRSDPAATQKLRAAQRAWIAFRDAQVEATFPAADKQAAYGSVFPMCVAVLLEQLTETRTSQLRQALNPEEGDVCSGGPA